MEKNEYAKFNEYFKNKTTKELEAVLLNKNDYLPEVILLAEKIIKNRKKVGYYDEQSNLRQEDKQNNEIRPIKKTKLGELKGCLVIIVILTIAFAVLYSLSNNKEFIKKLNKETNFSSSTDNYVQEKGNLFLKSLGRKECIVVGYKILNTTGNLTRLLLFYMYASQNGHVDYNDPTLPI